MGFLTSPDPIYNVMNWKGRAKRIVDADVINILKPIEYGGYHWSVEKSKLVRSGQSAMATETPWIHNRQDYGNRCPFDHQICFNTFNIIPPKCLECWKTVVTPRNFDELMKLNDLQKSFEFSCKCGIEVRDYTPKFYGGYHYANSLDEGLDMCEYVKKAVAEHIDKDLAETGVLLKRGCTEYEFLKGPSPMWHMTPKEEDLLALIEHYVEWDSNNVGQSKEAKQHVLSKWFLWAHANGDMTYLPYNDNEPLFPGYVRYDDKDRATIKEEIALAKAYAISGVKGKDARKMLGAIYKAADKYQIDPNVVLNMGHNTFNPLRLQPHLIGEDDEL